MLIDFRQLFPKYNIRPKGVLHVGANVGEEAPIYDELNIQAALFIEANPEIFQKLEANLLPFYNKGRDYTADCYCVSDVEGEKVMFHVSNNGSQSSSILEFGTHLQQHPDVKFTHDIEMITTRLDTHIPKDLGYDFLNMDLQGAEMMALKGMGDLLNYFKWAYLEVNKAEVYKGCAQVSEMDAFMKDKGFRRVETARWIGDWTDALYIR